jgi:endonuclease/exonuclease/phosphatase family metal-dependent hydrolase
VDYYGLKNEKVTESKRKRILEGLVRLRKQLDDDLPDKTLESTFLLATWNIREFGGKKYGGRSLDAYYFIAEILSRFDLVAIQEVRRDLYPLRRVLSLLGGWWDYMVADVTYGTSGNDERMAFVYDKRTVRFDHVAGEIVLPSKAVANPVVQIARTPYICSFCSSWTRFDICAAHMYWGNDEADEPRRVEEIRALAALLAKEVAREANDPTGRNVVLLGDFNVFNRKTDKTMKALEAAGFEMPPRIRATKTNALGNREYDQIAYLKRGKRFDVADKGGVLDFYKSVFRAADEDRYAADRDDDGSYETWRTYQMSDHLPLWVEMRNDFSPEYLADLAKA